MLKMDVPTRTRRLGLVGSLVSIWLLCAAVPASALGPDSPQVRRLVSRGLAWLATQQDDRLGAQCLIGLAFLKAGQPASHPKVQQALQACQSAQLQDQDAVDNYSVGLAAIFLLERDAQGQRPLIQRYLAEIVRRQKPNGAWGYPHNDQGDTSQTQYPLLALWLASRYGLEAPPSVIERACLWLLRTQDPSGGWGYQGQEAPLGQRVAQQEIRPSLVAAAMGSLYVCGDLLGLRDIRESSATEESLPPALRPIGQSQPAPRRPASRAVDRQLYQRALDDGQRWLTRNYTLTSEGWSYYYLYAWERYHSFRELAERRIDPDPRWYNDVVAFLQKEEQMQGGWLGENEQAPVATAFAILVLVRSMQKTLQQGPARPAEGLLVGGIGLPPQTADLKEVDGRVVTAAGAGTLEELMAELKKAQGAQLELLLHSAGRVKLSEDVTRRSGQIAQLQALVTRGTPAERLAAVRVLGRHRNLDLVPLLILAMKDPDPAVVQEADRGLRYISGKFDGVGLPDQPQPAEVQAAIAAWKQWYLGLRPGGRLLD
jgi:hypothetical protein